MNILELKEEKVHGAILKIQELGYKNFYIDNKNINSVLI